MTWHPRLRLAVLGVLVPACLLPRVGWGQVQVGAEVTRERSTYHFENPSSYDTPALVPHFVEQHYVLDNVWFTGGAAYRAGIDWRTTAGITPVREALATDYDTFINPGGVVWVSGTTGDARMHSIRVAQEVDLGLAGAVRLTGGYRLTVDLADFLAGIRTDTRNGVVVSTTIVTSPEYTNAQSHEVFARASYARALSTGWELRATGDAAPAALNRLAIRLPEKYPGETLVYRTMTFMAEGCVTLVHAERRWPVALTLRAGRAWNYRTAERAERYRLAIGVSGGRRW